MKIASPSFLDDPHLRRLFAALNGTGEELRVVGGAVRNHFMGQAVHEIDLATTATPDVVMARAQAAGLKCVPTGLDHGTVTVIVDHMPFEITTLREDVETDGRRATVVFGRDFEKDALRRDFTFNALSVTADGTVYDYADGMKDIQSRHVRFIGDPATRISEDYLRILRYFRFHAAFAERDADPVALQAIVHHRDGLSGLSRERIRAELMKLLAAPGAAQTIALMSGLGLVMPLLGGVMCITRLAHLPQESDVLLKLAALAVFKREDAPRLQDHLRLSNAETQRLQRAAHASEVFSRITPPNEQAIRVSLLHFGREATSDALALVGAGRQDYDAARAAAHNLPEPKFPISGADLIARGMTPGKDMGDMLAEIEKMWILKGFPEDPAEVGQIVSGVFTALRK